MSARCGLCNFTDRQRGKNMPTFCDDVRSSRIAKRNWNTSIRREYVQLFGLWVTWLWSISRYSSLSQCRGWLYGIAQCTSSMLSQLWFLGSVHSVLRNMSTTGQVVAHMYLYHQAMLSSCKCDGWYERCFWLLRKGECTVRCTIKIYVQYCRSACRDNRTVLLWFIQDIK